MASGWGERAGHLVPDVVAGLVPGTGSSTVAKAAVREAVSRGARVRFLQVVPSDADDHDRAALDTAMFSAALKGLRESAKVPPTTFEIVEGDARTLLVEHSREALLLVVGSDDGHEASDLAAYCQEHAECDVLTVRSGRVRTGT